MIKRVFISGTDCVVQAASAVRVQGSEVSVCYYDGGRHHAGYVIQQSTEREKSSELEVNLMIPYVPPYPGSESSLPILQIKRLRFREIK